MRCARCGRILKSKISIVRGLGGECYSRAMAGKSKPVRGWRNKVVNTIKYRNGDSFYVGTGKTKILIDENNMNTLKEWLLKNHFILNNDEIKDELLEEISKNPDIFFEGDING